jgi:hypothetical protein
MIGCKGLPRMFISYGKEGKESGETEREGVREAEHCGERKITSATK